MKTTETYLDPSVTLGSFTTFSAGVVFPVKNFLLTVIEKASFDGALQHKLPFGKGGGLYGKFAHERHIYLAKMLGMLDHAGFSAEQKGKIIHQEEKDYDYQTPALRTAKYKMLEKSGHYLLEFQPDPVYVFKRRDQHGPGEYCTIYFLGKRVEIPASWGQPVSILTCESKQEIIEAINSLEKTSERTERVEYLNISKNAGMIFGAHFNAVKEGANLLAMQNSAFSLVYPDLTKAFNIADQMRIHNSHGLVDNPQEQVLIKI